MQESQQIKFGDELKRLYPKLLKAASGMVKGRDESCELLQQTLYELCKTPEKLERMQVITDGGKLEAFIVVSMYRTVKQNGSYQRLKLHMTEFREEPHDIYENLNSKLSNRIANEQIDLLISRLPDFNAELLRLWCFPNFSYHEASKATGLSLNHLRQINHESIKKIRNYVHRTTGNTEE